MLKTRVFIVFLFICILGKSQCDTISDSSSGRLSFKLSFIGSIIYPGIGTGIELPIYHKDMQVLKDLKVVKYYTKGRFISGNLNWYHHPGFHDNLYFTAEWIMRRTKYKGFISEFSAGTGFSRTFLGGTTYRVDESGNISIDKNKGYYYALLSIGGGFGYDFSMTKKIPLSVFGKMNLLLMFPYNSTIYLRPVLEIGLRYTPIRVKSKLNKESSIISKLL
jgi:hypothetical protein